MDLKVLIPFIIAIASFILSAVINSIVRARQKLKTDKKICPKCRNENVTYRGISKLKRVKKKGPIFPVMHYTFQCTDCKTRFEYYGEL